eukprot:3939806-Rhodomonas_salina.1
MGTRRRRLGAHSDTGHPGTTMQTGRSSWQRLPTSQGWRRSSHTNTWEGALTRTMCTRTTSPAARTGNGNTRKGGKWSGRMGQGRTWGATRDSEWGTAGAAHPPASTSWAG